MTLCKHRLVPTANRNIIKRFYAANIHHGKWTNDNCQVALPFVLSNISCLGDSEGGEMSFTRGRGGGDMVLQLVNPLHVAA